jgi:hypothetical protein
MAAQNSAPPAAAAHCGDGQVLGSNRDRLLDKLAKRKQTDVCTLWSSLNKSERDIFDMVTAYFNSCQSSLQGPSAQSTALEDAVDLYSINGAGVGTDSKCGGKDANRLYLSFNSGDKLAIQDMRRHVAGNVWRGSDDLAGPHYPFTGRDMIRWKKMVLGNSEGPQFHFFKSESDLNANGLKSRSGACGVTDPNVVEATIAFNWDHDSNPLCKKSWLQEVADKSGEDPQWDYRPSGCTATPPINSEVNGGGTHNGLGARLENNACVMDKLQLPGTTASR